MGKKNKLSKKQIEKISGAAVEFEKTNSATDFHSYEYEQFIGGRKLEQPDSTNTEQPNFATSKPQELFTDQCDLPKDVFNTEDITKIVAGKSELPNSDELQSNHQSLQAMLTTYGQVKSAGDEQIKKIKALVEQTTEQTKSSIAYKFLNLFGLGDRLLQYRLGKIPKQHENQSLFEHSIADAILKKSQSQPVEELNKIDEDTQNKLCGILNSYKGLDTSETKLLQLKAQRDFAKQKAELEQELATHKSSLKYSRFLGSSNDVHTKVKSLCAKIKQLEPERAQQALEQLLDTLEGVSSPDIMLSLCLLSTLKSSLSGNDLEEGVNDRIKNLKKQGLSSEQINFITQKGTVKYSTEAITTEEVLRHGLLDKLQQSQIEAKTIDVDKEFGEGLSVCLAHNLLLKTLALSDEQKQQLSDTEQERFAKALDAINNSLQRSYLAKHNDELTKNLNISREALRHFREMVRDYTHAQMPHVDNNDALVLQHVNTGSGISKNHASRRLPSHEGTNVLKYTAESRVLTTNEDKLKYAQNSLEGNNIEQRSTVAQKYNLLPTEKLDAANIAPNANISLDDFMIAPFYSADHAMYGVLRPAMDIDKEDRAQEYYYSQQKSGTCTFAGLKQTFRTLLLDMAQIQGDSVAQGLETYKKSMFFMKENMKTYFEQRLIKEGAEIQTRLQQFDGEIKQKVGRAKFRAKLT